MAQDSREIGMRVGAAYNQAVSIVAGAPEAFGLDGDVIVPFVEELAGRLLDSMDKTQTRLTGVVAVAASAPRPVVPTATVPRPQVPQAAAPISDAQAVANAQAILGGTVVSETTFSGNTKPMKLAEHPELPGWLHAQAAAVGVSSVWDNRGKPNYIAAINSGAAKTPPPFRSATDGVDKSFWPPASR